MSAKSKANLNAEMGSYCEDRVLSEIKAKKDGKLNGDNLDIFVVTNDARMKKKNKDYHFFATDWTPFRILEEDFQTNQFIKEQCTLPTKTNMILLHFKRILSI